SEIYITPTLEDVRQLCEAGADIVAFDATARPRPFVSNSRSRYHSEIKRQEIIYDENFRQKVRAKINPAKRGARRGLKCCGR
ncbi:hypothetical protein ACCS72_37885, partial [Rhizobium ruizarguesonis]